jgi:quercetin dioxygenase-like cupin family protein
MTRTRLSRNALAAGLLIAALLPLTASADDDHIAVSANQLKWGPAPPAFPKGAQFSVLAGNPTKEGVYAFRLKVPAGYKVPPHTHPQDENITVISGTFNIGMGDTFDEKNGKALKAGGFMHMPKGMPHFGWFTEESIVQFHGMGPQGIIYVNPADDPRKSQQVN